MFGLLKFLFLVLIVLAIVGYFRGWYRIARRRDPATGQLKLEMTFDSEKARDDARTARSRVEDVLSSHAQSEGIVQGTIVSLRTDPDELTLQASNAHSYPVRLPRATTVRFHNGAGALEDLHIGDNASINFRVEQGNNVAQVVTVERNR
jgi:hypothetical protein